ncbi:MAG: hypothetical protein ACK47B_23240 [Armatimonadota bacterium]
MPAPRRSIRSVTAWAVLTTSVLLLLLATAGAGSAGEARMPLSGTRPLEAQGDLAAQMVDGIHRFLDAQTESARSSRAALWKRDLSSPEAYARSVEGNRERLRRYLGAVDPLLPVPAEGDERLVTGRVSDDPALSYTCRRLRWEVLPGMEIEALELVPRGRAAAGVVAVPDCDWTPEMLVGLAPGVDPAAQFARRLAESGCRVLVPLLIDRSDTFSGNPEIRMTNQPHREFVYRGAFEMGRHVIGYEVAKLLSGVDYLRRRLGPEARVGVSGYGEGGLLALYAAAVEPNVDSALVSGYFGPREELWREPIYRNVWALLQELGDAEIASLVAPRSLVVEASAPPVVAGPPPARDGRSGAAPGAITPLPLEKVRAEVERARALTAALRPAPVIELTGSGEGLPGSASALTAFLKTLAPEAGLRPSGAAPRDERVGFDPRERLRRQVAQMVDFNQELLEKSERVRERFFWSRLDQKSPEGLKISAAPLRDYFWEEVIGRFPAATLPANPRSRLVYDEPKYRGYEVMLDVWPEVYAYGILLLPKDLRPGERRPVVVCQHGLEGRPQDVADAKVDNLAYHRYAARLAERGFITFSPQNPYIGQDRFRLLQRKLNPLKKSLFSVITAQHARILEWLREQPFVDSERIGFYGLSYGGKTAMRVPALLDGYCLSICSADFNEWIWKNVSTRDRYSYMFTGEWEMVEFNLGNTFNYAEMSALIAPRPFMVERGHDDGVAPDEQVAYEFAKVRRLYTRVGIPERTEIEFFNGPHTIHGVGTFDFLHRHLNWPAPR